MKILSIGNFGTSWDGSVCDEKHIADALEGLGHEVIRQQRESGWNEPMPNVDLVLLAQWDGYPKEMGFQGIPVVYWAFDFQESEQEWHADLVSKCDLYLSKPWSDKWSHKWQWLPQDFAPNFLAEDDFYEHIPTMDVLFTGSYLPWATERIETLRAVDKMFNLTIHSFTPDQWRREGFKHVEGPIMDEGLKGLYPRAKVNLSIDHTITPGYWSDRSAQIMACGGMVLMKYVPGSELVFRDNIAYFYNVDECLEKINYYLIHTPPRKDLAEKGREFAINNLMVENRVKDLLTIVGNIL